MSDFHTPYERQLTSKERDALNLATDILRRLDAEAKSIGWPQDCWERDAYQTGLDAINTVLFIHAEREQAQGESL